MHPLAVAGHAVVGLAGAAVVITTFGAALRTVVLPRAVASRLARVVFLSLRWLYGLRLRRGADFARRDAVMASYGPLALFALLATWLVLEWLGFAAVLWSLGSLGPWAALVLSGSSLLTLGFAVPPSRADTLIAFVDGATGLVLLALLITYLPSLYGAFSRREALVAKLEVRAGAPPTGWVLIRRAWELERFDLLTRVWSAWEDWFIDVEESHTSFPALGFFRSPQPEQSWVTAAGAVLDGAALYSSTVEGPRDVDAELAIRAGYLALRRIASFFGIPYDEDPAPNAPISVQREAYDEVLAELAAAGVPLRADRESAWRDFAGWRVNYDTVLIQLAALTMAPYAPWSSDRSLPKPPRPPIWGRTARVTQPIGRR